MERTSINAATTSSGDTATPTATPGTSAGQSPQPNRQTDRSNQKEPAHFSAPTKRTREGGETKPAKKRTSLGLRLTGYANLREVVILRPTSTSEVNMQWYVRMGLGIHSQFGASLLV